jgi:predicted nucleic acid-binding protein
MPQTHSYGLDAAYLEIAIREKNALATVDQELRQASVAEGVELL